MRKIMIAFLVLVVLFPLVVGTQELDNKNLKGLNYARLQCEYNGVPFYKAYKSPKGQKPKEFNLGEAKATVNEAGFPISKSQIRAVYTQAETLLKKQGIRIADIRASENKTVNTILPTVTIGVNVMKGTRKTYFTLVYLTVSKWISNWSGTENIYTPMIVWWQKKMLATSQEKLNPAIEKAVKELMDDLILQIKDANTEEEEITEDSGQMRGVSDSVDQ